MKASRVAFLLILVALVPAAVAQQATPASPAVPKEMQTSLGLYLTPAEAYAMWKASPAAVSVIDVRTPEEYIFVGHPPMAWSIPLALQTWQWDPKGKSLPMKPNPDFVKQVAESFGKDDTILVICRSGGRSAKAVNALATAGYTKVYNVVEGFEGDLVNDPSSPNHGLRAKNGWRNAGLPATYDLEPARMKLPSAP